MTRWLGAAFFIFLCCTSVLGQCDNSTTYQTYQSLSSCLLSIPYDHAVNENTIRTLLDIIPSYVFVDSIQNSADPVHIPMNINLTGSLIQIGEQDYPSDQDFQQAVASTFAQLQDAHTRYTKPVLPYCAASFVMPFDIYSRVSGTPLQQQFFIQVDPVLQAQYNLLYPALPSIDGYQIIEINGSDPLTTIGQFANTSVGYSKDYSARFNLAIDGYGGTFRGMFTWRNQSLQGIPSSPSLPLSLQDSQGNQVSVSINWIGVYAPFFNYTEQQIQEHQVGVHQLEFLEKVTGLDRSNDYEEPSGNPDVYYTFSDNNTTGILRIYTFSPKNSSIFIRTVEEAACAFSKANISKMIIDVTQNGGGNVCLGYAVSRFLFPHLQTSVGAYDIKASDLFKAFADAGEEEMCNSDRRIQVCGMVPELVGYFTPCAWYDWYMKDHLYYDETWFIPGNTLIRGGITGEYSNFVSQGCQDEFNLWIPSGAAPLNLAPGDIIVVSDGLCGSTCAVFARHLQLTHSAKTVTVGGVLGGQQPSLTSFPGGEVVHLSYIHTLAARYGVDSALVPPPLPTTADFRFAIREILGWENITVTSVPQEFTYLPADWQIFYQASSRNHSVIWNQLTPFFDKCAPWEVQSCDIPNGVGVLPCVNGAFGKCTPTACDPGYILADDLTSCYPCDVGFFKSGFRLNACSQCLEVLPDNCRFTSTAVSSPTCPFTCTDCPTCAPSTDASTDNQTVTISVWWFCLMIVTLILVSFATATILACYLSRRYFKKEETGYELVNQ